MASSFQPDNYDNPVKYFYEDFWVSLESNRSVLQNIFIKKNLLILHDDIFGIFSSTIQDYFYLKSETAYYSTDWQNEEVGVGVLYLLQIQLDKHYDIYERQVYTFSMVMQDVGGLFNSLYFVGLLIYSFFRDSLLFSDLVSRLFSQFDHNNTQRKSNLSKGDNSLEESSRNLSSVDF